jgi:putative serine protease PepD
MQLQTISQDLAQATGGTAGLFVAAVTPGGAADKAGLRPGDVIVEIDGEPAQCVDALIVKRLQSRPGDVIRLKHEREGVSHSTELTLSAD